MGESPEGQRSSPRKGDGADKDVQEAFAPRPELIVVVDPAAGVQASSEGLVASTADIGELVSTLDSFGAEIAPLFGVSEDRLRAQAASEVSVTGSPAPDLSVYYRVHAPEGELEDLAQRLTRCDGVKGAYVKPPPELPQEINDMVANDEAAPPASPDFTSRQGYLDAAPGGIDARHAWVRAGGLGADVRIIDVEGAWRFTHEDLIQNQGGVIGGTQSQDLRWRNHGTAVVGAFGGDQSAFGVTGICPQANTRAHSIFDSSSAAAILAAARASRPGDIILIELHRPGPDASGTEQDGFIAMEWWPDDFDAVRYATNKGVVVVEAAGNGARNLDAAVYDLPDPGFPPSWTNPFKRSNRDSGAIVVGAGAPPPGTHGRNHGPDRSRLGFSNWGALVDAQGWGREVTTAGYGDVQGGGSEDVWYTDTFSGTSSASPIVVGALGCLQGVLKAAGRPLLTPAKARSGLRSTGSPQQDAPGRPASQRIGNRPDLRELIELALKP